MKKDIFDNIGERLGQHKSPVDFETEWSGILDRQKKDKKKKMIYWFWGSFVLLLFFTTSIYLFTDKPVNSFEPTKFQKTKPSKGTLETPVIAFNNNSNEANDVEKEASVDKSNIKPSFKKNATTVVHSKISSLNNKNTITDKPIEKVSSNIKTISTIPSNDLVNSTIGASKINVNEAENNFILTPIVESNTDITLFPIEEIELENNLSLPIFQFEKEDSPSKRKSQLFFNGGLAITDQHLKSKDSASELYRDLRNNSEQALETYSYNAGVNIFTSKKSFISLAANYNISFDKIDYTYQAPKDYFFENVLLSRTTYQPSGNVEEVYGDTTIIGTQTISITDFNKYQTINISASFGYTLLDKERFSISAIGGLSQNIYFKASGKMINADDTSGELVDLDGFKKTIGLGLIGSIDFDYKINDKLFLNLRPSASYNLFSATIKDNPLSSNFYNYGINLGLKYNL